jgi:hypothetical protein
MLSSVLASKQAIAVNIQIIRVFTKMREIDFPPVCSRLRSNKREGNLFEDLNKTYYEKKISRVHFTLRGRYLLYRNDKQRLPPVS